MNKECPGTAIELRLSAVAYKDHGDRDRLLTLPFTKNVEELRTFFNNQRASGCGGDIPEDVIGGLKTAANEMDWAGHIKFVLLIADAPAHGEECSEGFYDK